MKGLIRFKLSGRKVEYEFTLRRNITIIRGVSGNGKTTLVNYISDYNRQKELSGITLNCIKNCIAVSGNEWRASIEHNPDSIIFIDENNDFVKTHEFADVVKRSDNYFVIINRDKLPSLPYSCEEIYTLKESGKYTQVNQTYNTLEHIYEV